MARQAALKTTSKRSPELLNGAADGKAPRVGHKKSRKGCAQCKRRHVKCNEEAPCSNCVRHGVACSLAGGPYVPRDDAKDRRTSAASSSSVPRTTSQETSHSQSSAAPSATASATASTGESPITQPSPFAILTGLIDRPLPGQDQNWLLDFELLHHYLKHTNYILTEHSDSELVLRIWQEEVPNVAYKFDYVMHGLLGFSALHKAFQEPALAKRLQTSAVDHLDKALVLYRRESGPASVENSNAKFIFTWLVVLFAFAIPPSVPPIDAMVELFMLVRGIDTILAETWYWVTQGPFASLITGGPSGEGITHPVGGYRLPEGMDFGLNHLDYMLGVDAMLPDDRRVCALVLAELKQMYEGVLRARGNCSPTQILIFPKQESGTFSQLIKRRVPQALIILAYYCVLLDALDRRWWIHGWSSRVLRDVVGTLEEQWRTWIEWPVQSVLLKERTPLASAEVLM